MLSVCLFSNRITRCILLVGDKVTSANVSAILRDLRSASGKTQEQVSEACGFSKIALVRYESGARVPRVDIARKLADYYGVTVDYILGHNATTDQSSDDPLSPLKQEILSKLDGLSEDKLSNAISYIDFLKSNK